MNFQQMQRSNGNNNNNNNLEKGKYLIIFQATL